MLRKYKKSLLITSLVTLLPIPLQLLLGRDWSLILAVPLMMLAVQWFCIYWTCKDPQQENQGKKPMAVILWIIPVLTNVVCGIDYALVSGLSFSISAVLCSLLGLMFLVIGNYMPKTRQNSTLGIKIPWTYTSEENWNATHRFAGRLWVVGGGILLLAALLPERWAVWILFLVLLPMCLVPMIYSWRYYRMQKARGDVLIPFSSMFSGKAGRRSAVFLVAALVLVSSLMFTGDLTYRLEEDYLVVEASLYDDLILPYDAMESIEYREEFIPGIRAWGFASGQLLMGTFQNEEFGNYTRYTYTGSDCGIVITTGSSTVVLSAETPEETQALYRQLTEKSGS